MTKGILGRKVGMTQIYDEAGLCIPVTVVQAGPCHVLQVRTKEHDGYDAVQIGLVEKNPPRGANKASVGHHKKANVPPTRVQREVTVAKGAEAPKPGDQVLVSIFNQGERVDIIGTSKGHGFQGVVKRHHFAGGAATHGSMFHRAPGSIGASSFPSRVIKGMRAPGRMGGGRVTIHNLKVLRVDADNHLLIVEGGIPGAPSDYVIVRKAVTAKKIKVAQVEKPKKGKK